MKKHFLAFGIILLLAFSGCVQQDISQEAAQLPEIRAVLDEYPNAYLVTLFMKKDVVALALEDIRKDCPGLEPAAYWNVTVGSGSRAWEFYVDQPVSKVVCAIYPEELPLDECSRASECDDFDAGTRNECVGNPMKCIYTPIVECVAGDNFCPANCSYANDTDCPAIDTCHSDAECDDFDSLTIDSCIGMPKYCVHTLKSCSEAGGYECTAEEECRGSLIAASGEAQCCSVACTGGKSCTGIVCGQLEKCVNALCVKKTCQELEFELCSSSEVCTGSNYVDGLGIKCCTGACRQPCDYDGNCDQWEICEQSEKYCVAVSCADLGGKTCDSQTEWCAGEKESTLDNSNCCLDCRLKTCSQRDGIVCDASKGMICSGSTEQTLDRADCCLSGCVQETCFDRPCAINKKCVDNLCALKTCAEMPGIDWALEETCPGSFYVTEGLFDCCVPKTCIELGGTECNLGTACNAKTTKATDTEECCIGNCILT